MTTQQALNRAIKLHRAGRVVEAARLFEHIPKGEPRNLAALQHLAIIHANRGEFDHAEALFRRAANGNRKPAIEHLRRAVASRPGFTEALCLLAVTLQEDGRSGEALDLLVKAATAHPDNAVLQHALGRLRASEGDLAEARQNFEAAIARQPDWGVPYDDFAQIHSFEPGDPKIGAMERLLHNPAALNLDGRIGLHRGL